MCAAAPAQAQPSLGKAKELYVGQYDEALTMFNTRLEAVRRERALEDAATIAMYGCCAWWLSGATQKSTRPLTGSCRSIPSIGRRQTKLSPRIRTAVSTARVRVLPALVQRRYEESKTMCDRGEFASRASVSSGC